MPANKLVAIDPTTSKGQAVVSAHSILAPRAEAKANWALWRQWISPGLQSARGPDIAYANFAFVRI